MKRGYFSAGSYGKMKRRREDWRSIRRKNGRYYDVMGSSYKTKREAASGQSFIRTLGL